MATTAAELWVLLRAKDEASKVVKDFGGNASAAMKVAGLAVATAGAGIVAGLGASIKSAADFQQSLANVGSVTGATAQQMAAMRAAALKIGADTSKGAGEAVTAMGELVKAGMSVEQVVGGAARAVVQMAEATGVEMSTAANLVSNALNTFSADGLTAAQAADLLAKAANASAIGVTDLGMSLSAGGSVAAQAGISMQDFAAAIGLMGNNAIVGSDAGTSLKAFIAGLTPNSKEASGAMRELGFSAFDAAGKWKSFPQIVGDLQKAFAGLTPQQRAMKAELLFGSDGIRAFNVLMKEGVSGLDEFKASMAGAPSLAEQSAARLNTLSGRIEMLKGSLETIAIEIGTVFLPVLTMMVGFVADRLPGAFEQAKGAVAPLLGAFASAKTTVVPVVRDLVAAVGGMGNILPAVAGAVGALAAALVIYRGAQLAANAAALANPFTLIVAAIAAAGAAIVLIIRHWDTLTARFPILQQAADGVMSGLQAFGDFVMTNVVPALSELGRIVTEVIAPALAGFIGDEILPRLEAFGGALRGAFEAALPIIAGVVSAVADRLMPALSTGWDAVSSAARTAFAGLQTTIGEVVGWVQDHWGQIEGVAGTIWGGVATAAVAALGGIREGISGVRSYLDENWGGIEAGARAAWGRVVEVVVGAAGDIVERVGQVVDLVRDNWDRIADAGERAWSMLVDVVGAVIDTVKEFVSGLADWWQENAGRIEDTVRNLFIVLGAIVAAGVIAIAYLWDKLGDPIIEIVTTVFNMVKGIIGGQLQVIGGILQVFFSVLSGDWQGAWDGVKDILEGSWRTFEAIIRGSIDTVLAIFTGLGGAILSALGDLGGLLWNVGWSIIQGMWNGITAKWDEMVSGIQDLANKLPGPIKKLFGIGSPSRLFAKEIGEPLAEGIGVGFAEKMQEVIPLMLEAVGQVTPAISGLAATMAGSVAAVDQYRDALAGEQASLRGVQGEIRALQRELLNTAPRSEARKAIQAQIAELQTEARTIQDNIRTYRELASAVAEGTSALDGFNDALASASRDMAAVEQFGQLGVKAIDALAAALVDDTPKAGAAAVKAMQAAADAARKAGVPNWQELAAAQVAAYGAALDERTPEAIQAALDATQAIHDATVAHLEAQKPTLQSAIRDALGARVIAGEVGSSWAAMFVAVGEAIDKGKDLPVERVGAFVADVQGALQELPEFLRGQLGAEFDAAMQAFLANPTQEALARVRAFAGDIHAATRVIPQNLHRLAPEVRAAVMEIWRQFDAGTLSLQAAVDKIKDVQDLIPDNLRKLTPAVQDEIRAIVAAWDAGALSMEAAQDRINDVIKAGEEAAKRAEEVAKRAAEMAMASAAATYSATQRTSAQRPTGTNQITAEDFYNYLGVRGLTRSLTTENGITTESFGFSAEILEAYGGNIQAIMEDLEKRLGRFMPEDKILANLRASAANIAAAADQTRAAGTQRTAAVKAEETALSAKDSIDKFGGEVNDFGQIVDKLGNVVKEAIATDKEGNATNPNEEAALEQRRRDWEARNPGRTAPFDAGGYVQGLAYLMRPNGVIFGHLGGAGAGGGELLIPRNMVQGVGGKSVGSTAATAPAQTATMAGQPPIVVNINGDTYGVDKLEKRVEQAVRAAMARRI